MTDLYKRHRAVLPDWLATYYEHPLAEVGAAILEEVLRPS